MCGGGYSVLGTVAHNGYMCTRQTSSNGYGGLRGMVGRVTGVGGCGVDRCVADSVPVYHSPYTLRHMYCLFAEFKGRPCITSA